MTPAYHKDDDSNHQMSELSSKDLFRIKTLTQSVQTYANSSVIVKSYPSQ